MVNVNYSLKNTLATSYKAAAINGALFSASPGTAGAATNEITGGAPAYARKAITWGTVASGAVSTTSNVVFDVASGVTVSHFGVTTSATATTADVLDWYAFGSSQPFSSQGTLSVSATITIS